MSQYYQNIEHAHDSFATSCSRLTSSQAFVLNFSLYGKLCFRDDKNAAFVCIHHLLRLYTRTDYVTQSDAYAAICLRLGESMLVCDASLRLHWQFSLKCKLFN